MSRELVLNWPAKQLSPNFRSRSHWPRTRALKQAKADAHLLALAAGWHRINWLDGPLYVWADFYPPDRRERDEDNLAAMLKPTLDGIAEAIKVNDSRFRLRPFVQDFGKGARGTVRVRITAGPTATDGLEGESECPRPT